MKAKKYTRELKEEEQEEEEREDEYFGDEEW